MYQQRGDRRAFTLVELLTVMGVIAILAGILLPALGYARAIGRRTKCTSNLRQLALGVNLYCDDCRDWYPPMWVSDSPTLRWMDLLVPYTQDFAVYDCPSSAHILCPWDSRIYMAYGLNVYNFDGHCLWYGVKRDFVSLPAATIVLADSADGKYYVGSGDKFRDPVQFVDYRHSGGFVAAFFDNHVEHLTRTTDRVWRLLK